MRRLLIVWGIALGAVAAYPSGMTGQNAPVPRDVTFAKDVAPILFTNCAYCHRPGEVAPFSLLSYKDARPWAVSIGKAVSSRQMPPWNADPHYGSFRDPRRLTDAEIATIVAWVNGGAKEGNPADAPALAPVRDDRLFQSNPSGLFRPPPKPAPAPGPYR